ncbi:MAG: QueT transporter family protein [bacterium]
MREVFEMWKHTRMIVLSALTAAIFAAVLIPFKGIPLIPGFTEIRPANVIPVVFGVLFGPAAAWGAAFGNLIGDFFGTLSAGSLFGFFGNFFFAFVPYKLWGKMGIFSSKEEPSMGSIRQVIELELICLISAVICALIIAWGLELMGLLPFATLGAIISVNNFLAAGILGPFLLKFLFPRVKKWNLLWTDIMGVKIEHRPKNIIGAILIWTGGLAGLILGILLSVNLYHAIPFQFGAGTAGTTVVLGTAPFIIVFLIGCVLL